MLTYKTITRTILNLQFYLLSNLNTIFVRVWSVVCKLFSSGRTGGKDSARCQPLIWGLISVAVGSETKIENPFIWTTRQCFSMIGRMIVAFNLCLHHNENKKSTWEMNWLIENDNVWMHLTIDSLASRMYLFISCSTSCRAPSLAPSQQPSWRNIDANARRRIGLLPLVVIAIDILLTTIMQWSQVSSACNVGQVNRRQFRSAFVHPMSPARQPRMWSRIGQANWSSYYPTSHIPPPTTHFDFGFDLPTTTMHARRWDAWCLTRSRRDRRRGQDRSKKMKVVVSSNKKRDWLLRTKIKN